MAGNRTRNNCFEGNYAHLYTTIADVSSLLQKRKEVSLIKVNCDAGQEKSSNTLARNRIRINCLEGNKAHHSTTIAMFPPILQKREKISLMKVNLKQGKEKRKKVVRWPGIEPGSTAWKATMLTITPPSAYLRQCFKNERRYI